MQFFIVGGFFTEGKVRLIQHLTTHPSFACKEEEIAIILNEIEEQGMNISGFDSDAIQFVELRGGCPCCTLEGDLGRVLLTPVVKNSACIFMEVSGSCDIEQLIRILKRFDRFLDIKSYCVLEAGSLKPLLEIVPVVKMNIRSCDVTILVKGAEDGDEELELAKLALDQILGNHVSNRTISGDLSFYVRPGKPGLV